MPSTEKNPRSAARSAVRGIPLLHLLHKGASLDQLPGAQPAESIVAWFRRKEGRSIGLNP